jgi:hypothetical protein
MSDNEYVSRKVTLPKFGGAHKDFQTWWTRFLAFAAVYQFMQALTGTPETDLPSSDAAVIDTSTYPNPTLTLTLLLYWQSRREERLTTVIVCLSSPRGCVVAALRMPMT